MWCCKKVGIIHYYQDSLCTTGTTERCIPVRLHVEQDMVSLDTSGPTIAPFDHRMRVNPAILLDSIFERDEAHLLNETVRSPDAPETPEGHCEAPLTRPIGQTATAPNGCQLPVVLGAHGRVAEATPEPDRGNAF